MKAAANSRDRMRAVLVIVATIGMIAFNFLAATGQVNNVTPEAISNKYATILTPAGYAFTIWTLIYVGMAAFSIYQFLGENLARYRAVRSLYIFSCLLNCGWIYFWHREQIGVCLVFILALLATLLVILFLLRRSDQPGGSLFTHAPFGIYAGWVTAASMVNFVIFLKYSGIEPSNILAVVLILFSAAMAIIVRVTLRNFLYPLAIAWALTAIAINQGGQTAIVVATAAGVVICLITSGSIVTTLRDSTSE